MKKTSLLSLVESAFLFVAVFAAIVFLGSVLNPSSPVTMTAVAQTSDKYVEGQIWSPNIGWIYLHGNNDSANEFGVKMNNLGGALTGYAWSSNIGWIKFGDLGTPPDPTLGINAKINLSTGKVDGWARACVATANATTTCSGNGNQGWDGWISLSSGDTGGMYPSRRDTGCVNYDIDPTDQCDSGVYYNTGTGKINGFAWSGDIGWLRFNASVTPTSGLYVECTLDRTENADGSVDALFFARPFNNEAYVTYTWEDIGGDVYDGSGYSKTYTESGPGPIVTIKDSLTNAEASANCPAVIIAQVSSDLDMKIGSTVENASRVEYSTYPSRSFGIKWNELANGYSCVGSVTPNDYWNWTGSRSGVSLYKNNSLSPLAELGTYVFTLTCNGTVGDPPEPLLTITDSVILKLKSTSGGEI